MASVETQLAAYQSALSDAIQNGDQAVARKIEQQIEQLKDFQARHPEVSEAPSPFEVFCDLNPSDINCLVYDD